MRYATLFVNPAGPSRLSVDIYCMYSTTVALEIGIIKTKSSPVVASIGEQKRLLGCRHPKPRALKKKVL